MAVHQEFVRLQDLFAFMVDDFLKLDWVIGFPEFFVEDFKQESIFFLGEDDFSEMLLNLVLELLFQQEELALDCFIVNIFGQFFFLQIKTFLDKILIKPLVWAPVPNYNFLMQFLKHDIDNFISNSLNDIIPEGFFFQSEVDFSIISGYRFPEVPDVD